MALGGRSAPPVELTQPWLVFSPAAAELKYAQSWKNDRHPIPLLIVAAMVLLIQVLWLVIPDTSDASVLGVSLVMIVLPCSLVCIVVLWTSNWILRYWSEVLCALWLVAITGLLLLRTLCYADSNPNDSGFEDCAAIEAGFVPVQSLTYVLLVPPLLTVVLHVRWTHSLALGIVTTLTFLGMWIWKLQIATACYTTLLLVAGLALTTYMSYQVDYRRRWEYLNPPLVNGTGASSRQLQSAAALAIPDVLSEAVSASPHALFVVDGSKNISFVSAGCQLLLGVTPELITSKPFLNLVAGADRQRVASRLDEVFSAHVSAPFVLHVTLSTAAYAVTSGDVAGMDTSMEVELCGHCVSHNRLIAWVWPRNRGLTKNNAQIPATPVPSNDQSLGRITTYATNELLNALHALDASTLFIAELETSAEMASEITDLLIASRDTYQLVMDVLALVQLNQGSYISAPGPASVRQSVEEVVERCKVYVRSGVELVVKVGSNVPRVMTTHWSALKLVLSDSLVSAVRHSPSGSQVQLVLTSPADTMLQIQVIDNGNGLENTNLSVLETALKDGQFVQGTRGKRMAMVVSVCKQLMEAVQGSMRLSREGSKFVLSFTVKFSMPTTAEIRNVPEDEPNPMILELQEASRASDESKDGAPESKPIVSVSHARGAGAVPLRMHVLFVDDASLVRRLGATILDQLGCTHVMLDDGDQVIKAIEESHRPFDAIVMDIVMHRSDGAEVCKQLRQLGTKCPIIAMTVNTDAKSRQRFADMGFDLVLPKPFNAVSMAQALQDGRQRRGNTTLARMSAHLDEDRHRPHARDPMNPLVEDRAGSGDELEDDYDNTPGDRPLPGSA